MVAQPENRRGKTRGAARSS